MTDFWQGEITPETHGRGEPPFQKGDWWFKVYRPPIPLEEVAYDEPYVAFAKKEPFTYEGPGYMIANYELGDLWFAYGKTREDALNKLECDLRDNKPPFIQKENTNND